MLNDSDGDVSASFSKDFQYVSDAVITFYTTLLSTRNGAIGLTDSGRTGQPILQGRILRQQPGVPKWQPRRARNLDRLQGAYSERHRALEHPIFVAEAFK